jgi:hypothetical protein
MSIIVDIYPSAAALPSPDSVGKGGLAYDGSNLRVSNGDTWDEDVTVYDDLTVTDDLTVPTGGTIAVADADALTVGGVKIGTTKSVSIELLAASVDKWCFIADRAYEVTGISEVHSVAGGSAAAVKFRKVTDVSAPGAAAGATVKELATAAFDLTTTADTVVAATLSATPADYRLAAGNKIGADFSGTLTGLVGLATIHLKAI